MDSILIVEDSRTQAERLRAGLTDAGFRVVAAGDGESALERLNDERIDLVLSDIVMPRMDGYELCRRVKDADPDLPVVLLTSLTDPLDVVQGLLAGADNFFRKPYDLAQLVGRLRGILYNHEMRVKTRSQMGLELYFLGRRFTITAERQQLLDLLVSTFEDLVITNEQLRDRENHLAEAHAALAVRLQETEEERQRMRAVLAALPVGMMLVDATGAVVEANEVLLELLGHDREAALGAHFEAFSVLVDHHGKPLPEVRRPLGRVLKGEPEAECGTSFDVFARRTDGTEFAAIARAAPVRNTDGHVTGAVGIVQEIGGLAEHHPLTGLPTHSLLIDRVHQAAEASGSADLLSGVLVVAIDRISRVREASRSAYDAVVRATAGRLEALPEHPQVTRRSERACVAYLDDGEFAVVLTGLRREVDAVRLAELVVEEVSGVVHVDGTDVMVSASVGVVVTDEKAVDATQLVAAAVEAARAAGRAGGHRVEVAATAMQQQVVGSLQLESELRNAIATGELTVHYQPQLVLPTGRVGGIEALVRWRHPGRGLVPPGEFIPLAEESGLIAPLGAYVLGEACTQAAAWRQTLPDASDLVLSVNLAADQLSDDDIVGQVEQVLSESGLAPSGLLLEITETTAMTDVQSVERRLHELKGLGVQLAIDDFGTGYSSLLQLQRFPLDALKIDRAFVNDMTTQATARTIVDASVRLALALGLDVVAEGVETHQQAEALLGLGCQLGQGFLWSRPLAPADFAEWWMHRQAVSGRGHEPSAASRRYPA